MTGRGIKFKIHELFVESVSKGIICRKINIDIVLTCSRGPEVRLLSDIDFFVNILKRRVKDLIWQAV